MLDLFYITKTHINTLDKYKAGFKQYSLIFPAACLMNIYIFIFLKFLSYRTDRFCFYF